MFGIYDREGDLVSVSALLPGLTDEQTDRGEGTELVLVCPVTSALFDLGGGVRIGVCERCGMLFSTRRADKRTCSPRCQEAAKKKRRRDDPEYRARELKRQRAARARGQHADNPVD